VQSSQSSWWICGPLPLLCSKKAVPDPTRPGCDTCWLQHHAYTMMWHMTPLFSPSRHFSFNFDYLGRYCMAVTKSKLPGLERLLGSYIGWEIE
jgi:hypothetical protein